jgi:hypothetical protein
MVQQTTLLGEFTKQPTQFFPVGQGLSSAERYQRAARLIVYAALLHAYMRKSWKIALAGGLAAYFIMYYKGRPNDIDPNTAGTALDPNPAGNALLGDIKGRDQYARTGKNLDLSTLTQRMKNPNEGYLDRAIAPALSPLDANYLVTAEPNLGSTKWTVAPTQPSHSGYQPRGSGVTNFDFYAPPAQLAMA